MSSFGATIDEHTCEKSKISFAVFCTSSLVTASMFFILSSKS